MNMLKTAILFTFYGLISLSMGVGDLKAQPQDMTPGATIDYNNISMPESPSAAAFGKVGNIGVNNATGIPNIHIPLYTYEVDGVKVPISISYNASGVKVADLATSVGLGWSLQAGGQFSRTVRAKADDFDGWISADPYGEPIPDSFYNTYDPNSPHGWQHTMKGDIGNYYNGLARKHDHNPDQFSYSFLGHSGSFIYSLSSQILKEKTDGIKITNPPGSAGTVEAQDLQGNRYEFYSSDTEKSNNLNVFAAGSDLVAGESIQWESDNGNIPVTAWKLSKVTTKNNKTILFDYQNVDITPYTLPEVDSHITAGEGCKQGDPRINTYAYTNTTYSFNTQLLSKIHSPDGSIEVEFNYATDNISTPGVWKTKLTDIVITDLIGGHVKEFRFVYDRFSGDPRLKLEEVYEVGYDENNQLIEKPPYIFTYNGNQMPQKSSFGQDFFGYNNGKTSNHSLVPSFTTGDPVSDNFIQNHSGDRSVSETYLKRGVLTNIQYPTGGSTHFTYEPNIANGRYYGGLIIKEIKAVDETGTYNKRTYQYDNVWGYDFEFNQGLTQKVEGNTTSQYSSFIATPGELFRYYKPGYFYGRVTVTTSDGGDSYKEEYYYEDNYTCLNRYDYALEKMISYKGNQPMKVTEYDNTIIGEKEVLEWNTLGDMMCYGNNQIPEKLGYNNTPIKVKYNGNYAFLPTKIATTEFLEKNSGLHPVTTLQTVEYDPATLLKTQEVVNHRLVRKVNSNGELVYDQDGDFVFDTAKEDTDGELLTTDYTYSWNHTELQNEDLPAALPISKVTHSNKLTDPVSGQYFEYDSNGNIKTTFRYNKGEGSNNASYNYIPTDYEEMSAFQFAEGKPVQVLPKDGTPTSYIWGYKNKYPVAKVEGVTYPMLTGSGHVAAIQAATEATPYNETNVENALTALRNAFPDAMITTYTHRPLAGVRSITDPKGDTITYHYDGFGRLLYVTDKDDNIVTENEYIYGN